ncbi:hypothetical protein HYH03_008567 [Edaphochlamys debaryana]|uniref:Uncharacterized protein n=1 Tax=Edaphochlamys debaryana TaxID=47281 RepID=A0A835XZI7_9CHLO|nr:hypothetical protein HYH03_008567 [Edaphochlamys debaryana]|eukprot:KAG2493143.1 hypothetical protein HYH03_008567 [Edaphochlamys debaryana]
MQCEGGELVLPEDSAVWQSFPCSASGWRRALHVLRHFPLAARDLLSLGRAAEFIGETLVIVAVRLPAILLLPEPLYGAVTWVSSYGARACFYVCHLLLDCCVSDAAWGGITSSHAMFDVLMSVCSPVSSVALELAYTCFSIVASLTILSRNAAMGCSNPPHAAARILVSRASAATPQPSIPPADVPRPQPQQQQQHQILALPASAAAGVPALPAVPLPSALGAPAPAPGRRRPPPYRALLRCTSQWIKIQGVDPEQLPPDWEARLRTAVASQMRDVVLRAAYVRSGCIELVLDLERRAQPGPGPGSGPGPGWAQDAARDLPDRLRRGARSSLPAADRESTALLRALGRRVPAGEDDLEYDLGYEDTVVVGGVVSALQLPLPATDDAALSRPVEISSSTWGSTGDESSGCRVVGLSPRVLILPPGRADRRSWSGLAGAPRPCVERLTMLVTLTSAWIGAAPPEVLVRAGGAYLPARVTAREEPLAGARDGSGTDGGTAVRYEVDFPPEGLAPGVAQLDLRRRNGRLLAVLPLLLLPAAEAALWQELSSAFAAADDAAATGPEERRAHALASTSYLLADLAACLFGPRAGCPGDLASHLSTYALASGLPLTWARLQETVEEEANDAAGAEHCAQGKAGTVFAQSGGAAGRRRRAGAWQAVVEPARSSLGLVRVSPAHAEAFAAHCNRWAAAWAVTITSMELLGMALALFRARGALSHVATLVWLTRCSACIITAFAWPLLLGAAWRALAAGAVRWRYGACLAARALAVSLHVPLQSSTVPYVPYGSDPALAVMDALLPVTCPLPLGWALALALLRVPLNARAMGLQGAVRQEALALLLALLVQVLLHLTYNRAYDIPCGRAYGRAYCRTVDPAGDEALDHADTGTHESGSDGAAKFEKQH